MPLINRIQGWIDPDHHIPVEAWLKIIALGLLSGLLFLSTVVLALLKERSVPGSIKMEELSRWTYLLGGHIDTLHAQTGAYDASLRAYVLEGDTGSLSQVYQYKTALIANRNKMSGLEAVRENRVPIAAITALTDSAFAAGDRAIEQRKNGNQPAAMQAFARFESLDLRSNLLILTTELYRTWGERMGEFIEADSKVATVTYHKLLLPLIFLSGILFFLLLSSLVISIRQIIHDRREFEKLKAESRNNYDLIRSIINLAPVGFHTYDKNGLITEMNQTQLDWQGYDREEIVGKPLDISKLLREDSTRIFSTLFPQLLKDGHVTNLELNMVGKNGETFPAIFNSKAIFDEEGNFEYCISTVLNYTERKKLEEQLIAASNEAQNSNNLKQFFIANMSHEIRTPLNSIIGFSNLLSRAELPPNLVEFVEHIRVSGHALLNIVNDILDFEKIRSGVLQIENFEFNLNELLYSVVSMVRPAASEKSISLFLGIEAEMPSRIIGDPFRLTQILSNLLSNAVKFTEKGHVTLRAGAVGFDSAKEWVTIRFSVEDSGIGIPASEHERIFERFTQADGDTTRKYGGTGLGLTLVKMLVELQNGTVKLASESDKGSIFTVEIPYQWVDHSATAEEAPDDLNVAETLPDLSGFNVMLVEDEPVNRRIAEIYLAELGLSVALAADGMEAIRLLRNNPSKIDLVFMDIRMPRIDGYTATKIIRTELGLHELPIIAMTAHVLTDELDNVNKSGMNDILTKPINHSHLVSILLRYLGKKDTRFG